MCVVVAVTLTARVVTREGKYADAARGLSAELQNFPRSRAALSLLGYCYYYMQVRCQDSMGCGVERLPTPSCVPLPFVPPRGPARVYHDTQCLTRVEGSNVPGLHVYDVWEPPVAFVWLVAELP